VRVLLLPGACSAPSIEIDLAPSGSRTTTVMRPKEEIQGEPPIGKRADRSAGDYVSPRSCSCPHAEREGRGISTSALRRDRDLACASLGSRATGPGPIRSSGDGGMCGRGQGGVLPVGQLAIRWTLTNRPICVAKRAFLSRPGRHADRIPKSGLFLPQSRPPIVRAPGDSSTSSFPRTGRATRGKHAEATARNSSSEAPCLRRS
jgi:hypothetical protein